jgi:hypothetical protein
MTRFLVLLALLLAPATALAQTTGSSITISGITGCDATAINVATDCELRNVVVPYRPLNSNGYNLATLYIYYDWAAGTGYSFILQACKEGLETTHCTDATDWFDVQGEAYSSGTLTITDATITKAAGADDYSVWSVGINYPRMRLKGIVASGSPTASDKITVVAVLTRSDAF